MQSEVTLTIDMPPEDMRQLYEQARGNEVELARLIWLEHQRGKSDGEKACALADAAAYLSLQPPGWSGKIRGLTSGAMAALEMLDLPLFRDDDAEATFGDMLVLAYITQEDPNDWYDALGDVGEIKKRAVRWGSGIELPELMKIAEGMMSQVEKIGDVSTGNASDSKKKAAGRGSRITRKR